LFFPWLAGQLCTGLVSEAVYHDLHISSARLSVRSSQATTSSPDGEASSMSSHPYVK
jgi:hypothetical protein